MKPSVFCHPPLLLWCQDRITESVLYRRLHLSESSGNNPHKTLLKSPTPTRKPLFSHDSGTPKLKWNPDKKTHPPWTCCSQKYRFPINHPCPAAWAPKSPGAGLASNRIPYLTSSLRKTCFVVWAQTHAPVLRMGNVLESTSKREGL